MEALLEKSDPILNLKKSGVEHLIPNDVYEYYKYKPAILFILERCSSELIHSKLRQLKIYNYKGNKLYFKYDITHYILFYTNAEIVDLWNYLNPGIIRLYIEQNNEIDFSNNMPILLHLIDNYGYSFSANSNLLNLDLILKKNKPILLEIVEKYDIFLNETSKEIVEYIYKVKDLDFLKLVIEKVKNKPKLNDFHIEIMKIALINNHSKFIKYYIQKYNHIDDYPLVFFDYVLFPFFEGFNYDFTYDSYFKYFKKTDHKALSNNLKIIFNKIKNIYNTENLYYYLFEKNYHSLSGSLFTSAIRFNCIFLIDNIIKNKGGNYLKSLFTENVINDLFRYGKYCVLKYLILLEKLKKINIFSQIFSNRYDLEETLHYACFNSDDRFMKFVLEGIKNEELQSFECLGFLSTTNISNKTKIRKLRVLLKYLKLNRDKVIYESMTYPDEKLSFWYVSKFYNNKLGNDNGSQYLIELLLESKDLSTIKKLLSSLSDDFNYWNLIKTLIKQNVKVKHYNFIIKNIFFKLENIKKYPQMEIEIVKELAFFYNNKRYYYEDDVSYPNGYTLYNNLLKLAKACNIDLNLTTGRGDYSIKSNLITNDSRLFKIGIINGISFPDYFRSALNNNYYYPLYTNNIRPFVKLYMLIKRLEIRKEINNKKNHKKFFENTNICLKSRPPNAKIPALKNGGKYFYQDLVEFKDNTNIEDEYIYPIHINPLQLLDVVKKEFLITTKIDGETKLNIDKDLVFPTIHSDFDSLKLDGEYVEELDMYLVFGIRNKESSINCVYDDYQDLKTSHFYTKNDNDSILTSSDYSILKTKLINEYNKIITFYQNNKGKTLWYPKKFWLVYDTENSLKIISSLQAIQKEIDESVDENSMMGFINKSFLKTDGFIINKLYNKKEFYKLKPTKDMTIDLLYTGDKFLDKQDNKYDVEIDNKSFKGIYRCYFENGKWFARDFRPNKKNPNPKSVIKIVQNYHGRPWEVMELQKYIRPCYYQEFRPNHNSMRTLNLDRDKWLLKNINEGNTILDIGCGYLINTLWQNEKFKIDGIDIDLNILEKYKTIKDKKNKKLYIQDISQKWNMKNDIVKEIVNQNLEPKVYDVIVLNFTIHNCMTSYVGLLNLFNEINKRSDSRTKLMVSFIDKDTLFEKSDEINFDDGGFYKKMKEEQGITKMMYYYPWRHNTPMKESITSQYELESFINTLGWCLSNEYFSIYGSNLNGFKELSSSIKRLVFKKISNQ